MAARQPIPTSLPPYAPRYSPQSPSGQQEQENIEAGREIRKLRAEHPDDWEAWCETNRPELLKHVSFFGTDLGPLWRLRLDDADNVDATDEQLIARSRQIWAERVLALQIKRAQARAPETPAERALVDRYLDLKAYHRAVGARLGYRRGHGETAEPPRLRALVKRLRKCGLLAPSDRQRKGAAQSPSRADRAWEKAKAKSYWGKQVAEYGEEVARRMWNVGNVAAAHNAARRARETYLVDPAARKAFERWLAGNMTAQEAVLAVTEGA